MLPSIFDFLGEPHCPISFHSVYIMAKRSIENGNASHDEGPANKIAKVADESGEGWTVTRGPQIIEINGRSCQHEVAWPGVVEEEHAFLPPPKSKLPPAKQYPFPLDPFQQTAINCLEAGLN